MDSREAPWHLHFKTLQLSNKVNGYERITVETSRFNKCLSRDALQKFRADLPRQTNR